MKPVLKSQYKASLAMLREAIRKCSGSLWLDGAYKHPFWRVAYHTLFFTDLYLSVSVDHFKPWAKHIDELESLGSMIHKGGKLPRNGPAYAKDEIETYCDLVIGTVDAALDGLALDSESGFPWLPFSKLELQLYNIRHVQHHAGQIIERLRQNLNEGVDWVGAR